jgi:organic hydroperoxide reductase OsmC/OhrA
VTARFREEGSVLAGTKEGECLGFEIEVLIEGEEDKAAIEEMIRLAHRMCFTESALTGAMQLKVRHVFNGEELSIST